ncbi:RNA-binding RNA processing protein NOP9 SCDLUD_004779 [Saccharomycodes ludwigii]|uniref:RNA-binding RNA processing protein NOP9 n=1 Tax=Saccharomycodes ludwigii TaxID=36035 RepID=UPI001E82328A|nr:hypothetical protein SCDLUD_004779 [Saccharomycodes ludwigii]KAH3899340.1 hypothetical protein SCDLUD_004779 [Saccharomycodes ludwigii]
MGKTRGRRLQKKQKETEFQPATGKDQESYSDGNSATADNNDDYSNNQYNEDEPSNSNRNGPNTFFGVLDTQELEYFKQAESTIAIDTFENEEEKNIFINSVIEESRGKELKLATSQICSKLMERLILESDGIQLKKIFKSFDGFFYNISCQKYSSHVLETLLVRSTALVEKELLTPSFEIEQDTGADQAVFAPMESMFLFMLNELKPKMKEMISHQYASHVFRLIVLILSSKKLPSSTMANSTLRSKKSKIARKMIDLKDNDDFNKTYQTPDSFKLELKEIFQKLYFDFTSKDNSVTSTNITKFRELCVDKIASPVIQLIIQTEGIFDRDRKFWFLIFSKSPEKDPKEESFTEYLLSDAVGSHFLQNCISFTKPKYATRLYNLYMKDRVVKLSKRDTTGAYVIQSCLQNLGDSQVKEILGQIVPELSIILNSNIDFGIEVINASVKEGDFMKPEIVSQLIKKYYPSNNNKDEDNGNNILESCLLLNSSTLGNTKDDWPTAEERRRSIFLEKLIDYDDTFLNITIESMLKLPKERFLQMCYHGVFSHVVESILQVKRVDTLKRKLLLNILCTDIVGLSCNAYGSHIVDKLWEFTSKLTLYKERIAKSLDEESPKIKNSGYGKKVWKNWNMETYVRKNWDWKRIIREHDLEVFPDSKPLQPKRKFSKDVNGDSKRTDNKRRRK